MGCDDDDTKKSTTPNHTLKTAKTFSRSCRDSSLTVKM